jgi:hypothetical protein
MALGRGILIFSIAWHALTCRQMLAPGKAAALIVKKALLLTIAH